MPEYMISPCRDDHTFRPMLLFAGKGRDAQFTSAGASPVDVGHVSVDAARLFKPFVKIKFGSIVNLRGLAANPEATLTFRLYRTSETTGTLPLNSWVYDVYRISDNAVPLTFETSFAFLYCDRLQCAKCAKYHVEVSLDNLENASVTVSSVNMQAVAQ
jgi:hypothetical protein